MAIREISVKDINDKKITLELKESAEKGDQIIIEKDQLTSFECIGSWIETAVEHKYKSDIKKLQSDYSNNIADKIKVAKIEQEKETKKFCQEEIDKTKKLLYDAQSDLKHAYEKYKTSPEYLKILSDLETAKNNMDSSLKSQAHELEAEHLKTLRQKDAEINNFKEKLSKAREEFINGTEYQNMKKHLDEVNASLANIKQQHQNVIDAMNNKAISTNEQHEFELEKAKHDAAEAAKKSAMQELDELIKKAKTDQAKLFAELMAKKDKALDDLKEEIQGYKDRRSSDRNMKKLGNDLEQWCKDAIETEFEDDEFIQLGKVAASSSGEKADIVVDFLKRDGDIYKKATIECKTQAHDSAGNYKNDGFIDKLKKDAKNNKSGLAILVTELESQDEFTFRKHKSSSSDLNVFVCRPDCLVTILRLYNIFYKKESELAEDEGVENKYKNQISEKFMVLFNEFQEKIEKAAEHLMKKSEEVNKHLSSIIKTSEKAQDVFNNGIKDKLSKMLSLFEKVNPKFDAQFQKLLKSNIDLWFSDEIASLDKGDLN